MNLASRPFKIAEAKIRSTISANAKSVAAGSYVKYSDLWNPLSGMNALAPKLNSNELLASTSKIPISFKSRAKYTKLYNSATTFSAVIFSNNPISPISVFTWKIIGEMYLSKTYGNAELINLESTTESNKSKTLSHNPSFANNTLKSKAAILAILSNSNP